MDEDVVALMYEFEMQRATIESYKEGTHADLMEMAQSFLDLSTYSFQSTMGVHIHAHIHTYAYIHTYIHTYIHISIYQ